ncbi:MAG: (deoxy)nucleoside triphosphate pyrophosphohydrolase [Pseudomonadota bacterium]|nr:(deoxy)nucleoside triphosphate pyrophosphohydrolase [Pseudomonadota bacterium]
MPITGPDPNCLDAKGRKGRLNTPVVPVVAVALIDIDDRILLAQRPEGKPMGGLWEFPGGKVEEGETSELALIRELKEELGIDITENCLAPFSFVTHAYDDFNLLMLLYICRVWRGIPTSLESQNLKWVRLEKFETYKMPPADLPLVAMLKEFL